VAANRWQRVEALYHAALEREPAERADFLERTCGGDDALRNEVESLLRYDGAAGDFLERPALEVEANGLAREPGTILGERDVDGYAILSLLGAGGMGEVYRARDLALGREVALKVLRRSAASSDASLRRFEEEARLASALNHPNIVTIYGVGAKDDVAYIAMELVRGRTLRDALSSGPLPLGRAVSLAVQLADALAAAHAAGIVHRDLKPENLMLTEDERLKVLDFGIAKLHGSPEEPDAVLPPRPRAATQTGAVLGTAGYMSPEQAEGLPAEPASDQFSFGAILFEMLSGRRAFERDTPAATIDAIRHDDPAPLVLPEAASALRAVIARCLAKDPRGRFPETRDLTARLREIAGGFERPAAARSPNRRRLLWFGAAAAIAAAAGLAAWRARSLDTGIRSIAVLPFEKVAGGAEAESLADGLTRGVTRGISRLSSLAVRPRSAVLRFQGSNADPKETGQKLRVDAVVTGTLSQEGGRSVAEAALVDVRTGVRLWSRTYALPGTDALTIQSEIARDLVTEGIRLPLSREDRRELARRPSDDPVAYDLYLRAVRLCERGTEAAYLEARALLRKAVTRDPNFALAYVALATTYSVMSVDGYESPAQALPEITRNVRRALDADQDLPDAHSEAAVALFYFQWDWKGSAEEWRQALASRGGGFVPDFLEAYALQQWALGKPREALALVRRARDLDPLSLEPRLREADFLLHAGSLDEAAAQYESVVRTADKADPEGASAAANAWLGLAEVRARQGRFDDAIAAHRSADEASGESAFADLEGTARGQEGYREIERRAARLQLDALRQRTAEGGYASPVDFARAYARLGDRERAFGSLDAALAERSPGLAFLKVDAAWDGLRTDPRFEAVVRRVGLPAAS